VEIRMSALAREDAPGATAAISSGAPPSFVPIVLIRSRLQHSVPSKQYTRTQTVLSHGF
jgi:hypothetical protein